MDKTIKLDESSIKELNEKIKSILGSDMSNADKFDEIEDIAEDFYKVIKKADKVELSIINEFSSGIFSLLVLLMPNDVIEDFNDLFGSTASAAMNKVMMLLINMFFTTEEPVVLANDATNIFLGFTCGKDELKDIKKHHHDTEWFTKTLMTGYNGNFFKEIVLLFSMLSDFYYTKECREGFFDKYIDGYYNRKVFKIADDISSKFQDKFSDNVDANALTMNLFQILSNHYDNPKVECDDFINFNFDESIDINMLKSMISACVSSIMNGEVPTQHQKTVSSYIVDNWKANETPFVFQGDPYSDNPETVHEYVTMEALHKDSVVMHQGEKKIYNAYRKYKESEEKVDSQITKAVNQLKSVAVGDVRTEIIEGKKFSVIGLLKRVLATVGLFSIDPVKAVIALLIRYALKKKTTQSERRKILMELDTEIEMITEKIEDARGDGNREAKYAMMRTKKELENAKSRIEYGLEADERSLRDAKNTLDASRNF